MTIPVRELYDVAFHIGIPLTVLTDLAPSSDLRSTPEPIACADEKEEVDNPLQVDAISKPEFSFDDDDYELLEDEQTQIN